MVGYKLSKNDWVTPFFVIFRSVREKLLVTVSFDHPVAIPCLHRKKTSANGNLLRLPALTSREDATTTNSVHLPAAAWVGEAVQREQVLVQVIAADGDVDGGDVDDGDFDDGDVDVELEKQFKESKYLSRWLALGSKVFLGHHANWNYLFKTWYSSKCFCRPKRYEVATSLCLSETQVTFPPPIVS